RVGDLAPVRRAPSGAGADVHVQVHADDRAIHGDVHDDHHDDDHHDDDDHDHHDDNHRAADDGAAHLGPRAGPGHRWAAVPRCWGAGWAAIHNAVLDDHDGARR